MRKKCNSCGLIVFTSDENCKRCGSDNLSSISGPNASPAKEPNTLRKPLSIWNYLTFGFLAIVIEIAATSPIWGLIGSGPGGNKSVFLWVAFILNLPTILITWSLDKFSGLHLYFTLTFTPFTQIIFWFCLFTFLSHRNRGSKMN